MDLQTHGYIVGIVGLFYGTVGCGLSIFTCIFGAVLRRFFPELTRLPARKSSVVVPGPKILKRRQGQSPSRRASPPRVLKFSSGATADESIASEPSTSLRPPPGPDRLRRISSLDSFDHRKSFVLVAPVITINHVDQVDDISIEIPAITTLPNLNKQSGGKTSSKRRSLTIAHPPSLPNLPRLPNGEEARSASAFRLSSLKPFWGGDKTKPKIHRSASSPQLKEFIVEDLAFPGPKKESSQDRAQSTLSGKSSKKTLRQEKNPEPITSQPSHSKFFSAFPKSVEKKRSQALRTQPYEAPYFVPPPMPPMPLDDVGRSKGGKRSCTLPPEKLIRPSTAPQTLSKSEKTQLHPT